MKEITTNGIKILFVEVPEDANNFFMDYFYLVYTSNNSGNKVALGLPQANYQILGKSTELSKEQMKEICATRFNGANYHDYLKENVWFKTVQESYLSLLEANGIVDRNEYELPESGRDKLYDSSETHGRSQAYHEEWHKRMRQWQESQSKVKTYLVLKRI